MLTEYQILRPDSAMNKLLEKIKSQERAIQELNMLQNAVISNEKKTYNRFLQVRQEKELLRDVLKKFAEFEGSHCDSYEWVRSTAQDALNS